MSDMDVENNKDEKKIFENNEEEDEDMDDELDEYEIEDEQDLGDILSTFLLDSEQSRNIVDVAIEIRNAFTIQNKILKKLLDEIKQKN
jgi:hypothetical protein